MDIANLLPTFLVSRRPNIHVFALVLIPLALAAIVNAHMAAWHKAMFCLNGTTGYDDPNTYDAVIPLYKLTKKDWWFHHVNRCDTFPPAPGNFLDLPAGGNFSVEIAANRGQTTLSFNGRYTSPWPDGENHPDDWNEPACINRPNMHTQNETMAAGTAFAISYVSDISQVTPENLVVFSVKYHTPWKRVTVYQVPADLPACPPEGCICAWGWIPNGCGEPNMYMEGLRCRVTNVNCPRRLAPAKPAVWCEDKPSKCVTGAKQMIFWNQLDGNNIETCGNDLSGAPKSPAYNMKLGFCDGAQNDIFI